MGIWDSLKRNAPDLMPVKNTGKVISQYWHSEETRSKIGPFATSLAKYFAEKGVKFVPGVWALNFFKKSYGDAEKSENQTLALQAKREPEMGLKESEMGIWDYISGTTDSLKRNAPDLTPVKNWCSNSYDYSKATVSNVSGAVIANTGKIINQHWPSEETRSIIGPFATSLAKYSAEEGVKFVPGGVLALKVLKKSYIDAKKSENQTVDVNALQAKVRSLEKEVGSLEKEMVDIKKLVKGNGDDDDEQGTYLG